MKNESLIVEQILNAPKTKVWEAITDNSQMKQWYFELADFKPKVGFEFQFWAGPDEMKYMHRCKVIEVIDEEKITYSWSYEGYEGISYVTFELSDIAGATMLKLMHKGIETFPQDDPNFAIESFEAGWTYIANMLKEFVETKMVVV